MTDPSPFLDAITTMGVVLPEDLEPGDVITDVVAFFVISKASGATGLGFSVSEGTSWLLVDGIIQNAARTAFMYYAEQPDDDDEEGAPA